MQMAIKELQQRYFYTFSQKNNALYKQNRLRIANPTLTTMTILVASSNPNDKESIINLIKISLSIE